LARFDKWCRSGGEAEEDWSKHVRILEDLRYSGDLKVVSIQVDEDQMSEGERDMVTDNEEEGPGEWEAEQARRKQIMQRAKRTR
jgi:hypothetical protein